jgi:hypothetical protein
MDKPKQIPDENSTEELDFEEFQRRWEQQKLKDAEDVKAGRRTAQPLGVPQGLFQGRHFHV